MTANVPSIRLADHIWAVARNLAEIIDLDNVRSIAKGTDLRDAFMIQAVDPTNALLHIVSEELEMQLHRPESYSHADLDRRPITQTNAEIAGDRLIDILQSLDPANATHDVIARYIAFELTALWYPRCDGFREITELTGTNYRPLSELPKQHIHQILLRTPDGHARSTFVRAGVVEGPTPKHSTWMYMPQ